MKTFTILMLIAFAGLVKNACSLPRYEQSSAIDEISSKSVLVFNDQVIIIQKSDTIKVFNEQVIIIQNLFRSEFFFRS